VPIALLVAALLCCGFFPQSLVRMVTPVFASYLSANRTERINTQRYSDGDSTQRDGYNTEQISWR
jgi:hypothetical protein